jgi:type IV secretory pathway TrbL component
MRKLVLAIGLAATLGACGYSTGDRAVSGGLLGAGAGAAVGSLTGSAGTGALLGGAAGAAGGALTSPGTVNLGRPAWR